MTDYTAFDNAYPGFTANHSVEAVTRALTADLTNPGDQVKSMQSASRIARHLHRTRNGETHFQNWARQEQKYASMSRRQQRKHKRIFAQIHKLKDKLTGLSDYYRNLLTDYIGFAQDSLPVRPQYKGQVKYMDPQPVYAAIRIRYTEYLCDLTAKPGSKLMSADWRYQDNKGKLNSGAMTRDEFRLALKSHRWYQAYAWRQLEIHQRAALRMRAYSYEYSPKVSLDADVPF